MSLVYLGVDAGNSKTAALACVASGEVVGAGRSGCGDIYGAAGEAAAVGSVLAAADQALAAAGSHRSQVCHAAFRLAGVDWPEDGEFWSAALAREWPGLSRSVLGDGYAAIRCGEPSGIGVAVNAGTAAAIAARGPDGTMWDMGWWGQHAMGAIGLVTEALKAVYLASLGAAPETALGPALLDFYGLPDLAELNRRFTRRHNSAGVAERSRAARVVTAVARSGDPVAAGIVDEQGRRLAFYAEIAARHVGLCAASPPAHARLRTTGPPVDVGHLPVPVILTGSVLAGRDSPVATAVEAHLRRLLPGADPRRPALPPVAGAALDALAEGGVPVTKALIARLAATVPPPRVPGDLMVDRPLDELIDKLVARLSLEQKARLLSGATAWTTHAEPSIGLRAIVMSDGPVGLRGTTGDEGDVSACTPSPTALAASWDPELARQVGGLLAAEARRKGVDVLLAPTVNLHRTPLGGRHFECFSEDPYLTAEIGRGYVDGLQSSGVAATIKHYVANDSETDRFTYEAVIGERPLRELYLRPFEDIIASARPWLVMAAYNAVNGPTMTENPLLSAPLESEWNFDGLVVSDWKAVRSTAKAARAATDLAMPGPETPWSDDKLAAAVRRGEVDEHAVDEKVRRLLRLAARVGALEGVSAPVAASRADPPDTPAARPAESTPALPEPLPAPVSAPDAPGLLRRAAAAGMVLARNDGILPLNPAVLRRVAVIGPNAEQVCILGGGSARVAPAYAVTPLQGLTAALEGQAEIVHAAGVALDDGAEAPDAARRAADEEITRAAELAVGADVAIVIVGTSDRIESEGFDRTTLALPGRQAELVQAVLQRNRRTIVVVNSGAPVELPWLDQAPATLLAWFPGQEAGHALADVLTGAREPGGRMPTTWPRLAGDRRLPSPIPADGKLPYAEGLHIGYRGWLRDGAEPALPFGSGLGYTTWRFDSLSMLGDGADAVARVTLTNTGPRHGTQTVQLYLSRPDSTIERPVRWLAGFARVSSDPGDTVTVDVRIPRRQFAHWSPADHSWAYEPGRFEVLAGNSVASTPLCGTWEITPDQR